MPNGRTGRRDVGRTNGGFNLAVPFQAPSTIPARPGPALPQSEPPIAQGAPRETDTAAAGQQAAGRPAGVPSFEENPLGAIGFLLQQFAAGVQGRETPLTRIRREGRADERFAAQEARATRGEAREEQRLAMQQKAQQYQVIGMNLKATVQIMDAVDAAPAGQRDAVIKAFGGLNLPGLNAGEFASDYAAGKLPPNAKQVISAALADEVAGQILARVPGFAGMSTAEKYEQVQTVVTTLQENNLLSERAATIMEAELEVEEEFEPTLEEEEERTRRLAKAKAAGTAAGAGPPKPSERDKEIARLEARGIPTDVAQDIASGRVEVTRDEFNNPLIVNTVTGEARFAGLAIPVTTAEAQVATPDQQRAIMQRLDDIYGAKNFAKEFIGLTLGQLWGTLSDADVNRGRTAARLLREQIIVALKKSGRPPVIEQERILQIIPSTGIVESVETARDKLTEVVGELRRQRNDDDTYSRRRDVTVKERTDARERARAIDRVLKTIGEPKRPEARPRLSTQDEVDRLPAGTEFIWAPTGEVGVKD